MSPEQASGKPIDRRADLWACGAVLYHLLAGHPPFVGDNQLATLHALIFREPAAPLPDRVPPAVRAVIGRALAGDLSARYETADQMQRALEAAMGASGLHTSLMDVATFVGELTSDRIAERKDAIDLALRSVAQRKQVHDVLVTAFSSGPRVSDAAETEIEIEIAETTLLVAGDAETTAVAGALTADRHATDGGRRSRRALAFGIAAVMVGVAAISGAVFANAHRHTRAAASSSAPLELGRLASEGLSPNVELAGAVSVSGAASVEGDASSLFVANGVGLNGASSTRGADAGGASPTSTTGKRPPAVGPPPTPPRTLPASPSARPAPKAQRNGDLGF
jgi:serine/threonine-protein kinase